MAILLRLSVSVLCAIVASIVAPVALTGWPILVSALIFAIATTSLSCSPPDPRLRMPNDDESDSAWLASTIRTSPAQKSPPGSRYELTASSEAMSGSGAEEGENAPLIAAPPGRTASLLSQQAYQPSSREKRTAYACFLVLGVSERAGPVPVSGASLSMTRMRLLDPAHPTPGHRAAAMVSGNPTMAVLSEERGDAS